MLWFIAEKMAQSANKFSIFFGVLFAFPLNDQPTNHARQASNTMDQNMITNCVYFNENLPTTCEKCAFTNEYLRISRLSENRKRNGGKALYKKRQKTKLYLYQNH